MSISQANFQTVLQPINKKMLVLNMKLKVMLWAWWRIKELRYEF